MVLKVNKPSAVTRILICLLGGVIMFGFFGCTEKVQKYKVDYDGNQDWYENAKDEYAAGEEVVVYYGSIATDTDYSFFLDGERLNCTFEDDKGFAIRFTMPEHDVKLTCESHNSMVYTPPTEAKDTMLIDWYEAPQGTDGGGGHDEIVLYSYDSAQVRLTVYRGNEDGEETETNYLVPYEVWEECCYIIDRYQMKDWNDREDTDALDGVTMVCKFKDGDGYVRVTSEKMPEDGEDAFREIKAVLQSYVKDEYLAAD